MYCKRIVNDLVCLLSMGILALVTGCNSLQNDSIDVYSLGRITATAYLISRPNLDEKQRVAIESAYKVFDKLTDAETLDTDVPALLKMYLAKEIDDDAQLLLACEAVDFFWRKLSAQVDIPKLSDIELSVKLTEFRNGIRDVVSNYELLNQE